MGNRLYVGNLSYNTTEAEAGRKATVSVEEDGFMFAGGAESYNFV